MVRLNYVVPFSSVILLAANQLIGFPLNWPMRAPENRTVHKMTDENGIRYLKRLRFLSFHTIEEHLVGCRKPDISSFADGTHGRLGDAYRRRPYLYLLWNSACLRSSARFVPNTIKSGRVIECVVEEKRSYIFLQPLSFQEMGLVTSNAICVMVKNSKEVLLQGQQRISVAGYRPGKGRAKSQLRTTRSCV